MPQEEGGVWGRNKTRHQLQVLTVWSQCNSSIKHAFTNTCITVSADFCKGVERGVLTRQAKQVRERRGAFVEHKGDPPWGDVELGTL